MADINTESIGLFAPVIDDRSEEQLYQLAQQVVLSRSDNVLNDFSDSGPLGVLLRAQAFAGAELLYKVNKLPLALAVKLLELTGTVRRLGTYSTAQLTFYLSAPRTAPFTIEKGFQVDSIGGKSFFTDAVLTIPTGAASASVSATAEEPGADYNLPAFTITQFTQPIAFLASVSNSERSQGGADEETVENAISRGLLALRAKNPVSARDFEASAQALMGSGSRAVAIGRLGPDRETEQLGAIHLFLLAPTGEPANTSIRNRVYADISSRLLLGTSLYVSPMGIKAIKAILTIKLSEGVSPATVADSLWSSFTAYLSPASYTPGQAVLIQETAFNLRFVSGVEFIQGLSLNGLDQNVPMPNQYTLPLAFSLTIEMVDSDGNVIVLQRGAGEDEDYNPERPT